MGGYGSGRRWESKDTTSSYRRFDARQLQRIGYLAPGLSFVWQWTRNGERVAWIQVRTEESSVILTYKSRRNDSEDWQSHEYSVRVEWTTCHFGGRRAWFRCPASGCGRRVAILYCGAIFACRQCYVLVYDSQRQPAYERALYRAQDIIVKLGGTGSMDEFLPPRPKGMHRRTYYRLCRRAKEAEVRACPPWLLKHVAL
jgi:hypothetical protein